LFAFTISQFFVKSSFNLEISERIAISRYFIALSTSEDLFALTAEHCFVEDSARQKSPCQSVRLLKGSGLPFPSGSEVERCRFFLP
jgi:hypothetical protein